MVYYTVMFTPYLLLEEPEIKENKTLTKKETHKEREQRRIRKIPRFAIGSKGIIGRKGVR